ncbi:MAG: hypothetical protein F4020_08940 [Gammaproteobacteria bacterium]|nr:hypothetical protein [Gammaproteobacteria bacterium]MYK69626.1 hypothetical protein [Gammaproteobacteria bacterium]
MKILKSWWPVFIVGAVASSGGLLDRFWDWIPLDVTLAIGGIGLVCILRGIVTRLFPRRD